MGASLGKPYCMNAQKYLGDKSLTRTCKECEHIRYIGCPGFKAKTRNPYDAKTRWWLDWWYYNKPIPKDYHEIIDSRSPELCNSSCSINYDETMKKIHGDPRGRGGI